MAFFLFLSDSVILFLKASKHVHSQTVNARELKFLHNCHMSDITYQVSRVTCNFLCDIFFKIRIEKYIFDKEKKKGG